MAIGPMCHAWYDWTMDDSSPHKVRIRHHRRRDIPDGAPAHLVELASDVRDPNVLISACRWAFAARAIEKDQALGVFRHVLGAWRWKGSPEMVVNLIEAFELDLPKALSTVDANNETAADIILDQLQSCPPHAPDMVAWFDLMAPSDWMGWSGTRHTHQVLPGVAVYELAMLSCKDASASVLPSLFSRGLDPGLCHKSGQPLAASLCKAVDLDAFIAAGGDLRSPMAQDDNGLPTKTRLWEHLRKQHDLRPIIDAWSGLNEPDKIAAKLAHEYWGRLTGYTTAQEIAGLAKSHPQWATIEDEKGRNCAMYLLRLHQSCHRFLSTKQCQDLLTKTDHQGRDIWFHALSINSESRAPVKETLTLLATSAPTSPNPINGRGLLADILLDEDFSPGLFCAIDLAAAHKKTMKVLPATKWLAGSDADLDAVADLITSSALETGERLCRLSKFNLGAISKVMLAHADEIKHPGMCWAALVALAESSMISSADGDCVLGLVARSGKTSWSDRERELFGSAPQQAEVIHAGMSSNALVASTPHQQPKPSRAARF